MNDKLAQKLTEMTPSGAGDEVNKVVDNLAGKLGIAVDRVAPVADKVIQEISYRGIATAACWFILWVVVITICWILVKRMYRICNGKLWIWGHSADPPTGWGWPISLFTLIGLVFSVISIGNIIISVREAFAPTLYLLETIFNAGSK